MKEPLLSELSSPGRSGYGLPELDVPRESLDALIPPSCQRQDLPLPELSEMDVVRHFVRLSQKNASIDTGMVPLGSCTMKYNPKVNEDVSRFLGFSWIHPLQPEKTVQGALRLIYDLDRLLCAITGMEFFTLQPAAGAHGELTGMLMAKAYFDHRGEKRARVLVPDSSHGTNPATANMCGFQVTEVPSCLKGGVDLDALNAALGPDVAALMLTNPNTLGLFDERILKIAQSVHKSGALLYYDGANLNANLGLVRPGDLGFDIIHLNLHKTFSTPHGGGGPGAGPVGVKRELAPFLPSPIVCRRNSNGKKDEYFLDFGRPMSIGRVKAFWGNFLVLVRAYAYIRMHGGRGLQRIAEGAVLNANYVMNALKPYYDLPYDRTCQHEFVLSARRQKKKGVRALDIAKRLLDYGFHAPTVYFPLIVEEALMIEPTETESKATLDAFIEAMIAIAREAEENPDLVLHAPHATPVGRLDEVAAARKPNLHW
ncbi:MAG: aminomethyl-transferring glycine dehydrogenase subunit GcvPB [Armatimonadetes bacterium]|nr:aminomethyl-transferring glycine dehydrogenase subunit GcvPB [Armatimonadota bacterium]